MKKLTICCDFDDTMTQLSSAWVHVLNKEYNLNVSTTDIKEWDIEKYFPSLTSEQIYAPLSSPNFWLTVEEKSQASYFIKKLIEEGHQFYICTASHYKFLNEKFSNCLFRLFPFIDWKNIIICYKKQLIKCDILIDDAVHNIEGNYYGLLFDMPHNQYFNDAESDQVERVNSWEEIYNLIHDLSEQL